jgi:YHS domain-containing protein
VHRNAQENLPMPRRLLPFALLLALATALPALAISPVNKSLFGGVAIDGYDPVAYFTDAKPVEGKKDFTFDWKGATWRFASAANRDLFAKTPEKYAPQYGGYCAYAVAKGTTAGIDPAAWTVRGGKLYLNYDSDIQQKWLQDPDGYIAKADVNWPKMVGGGEP